MNYFEFDLFRSDYQYLDFLNFKLANFLFFDKSFVLKLAVHQLKFFHFMVKTSNHLTKNLKGFKYIYLHQLLYFSKKVKACDYMSQSKQFISPELEKPCFRMLFKLFL